MWWMRYQMAGSRLLPIRWGSEINLPGSQARFLFGMCGLKPVVDVG